MVLPISHRVSRVPWYSGIAREPSPFRLRGYHPVSPTFPDHSAKTAVCNSPTVRWSRLRNPMTPTVQRPPAITYNRFRLFPGRSPLLGESRLLSFPGGTEMVHFPPFASHLLFDSEMDDTVLPVPGCPIRRSPDLGLLATHRGFSQLATSFIASLRQGIRRVPLVA
jgi:hypothetical protein